MIAAPTSLYDPAADTCTHCGHRWHGFPCERRDTPSGHVWGVGTVQVCACPSAYIDAATDNPVSRILAERPDLAGIGTAATIHEIQVMAA